jgi:hypothetical protein
MNGRVVSCTLIVVAGLTSLSLAGQPPIKLELVEVKKVWDKAPHNAFTDRTRFKDQWYMAFREAASHGVKGNGDVRVIRSPDGARWESAALLDYDPKWDMRDAKLNVMADAASRSN